MNILKTVKLIFGMMMIMLTFFVMVITVVLVDMVNYARGEAIPEYVSLIIIFSMPYIIFRISYLLIKNYYYVDLKI